MCIKMNFSKKVIVTNHAVERRMERRVDMTPRAWNAYKKSPKKYIGDMLKERATDPEFKKLPVRTQFEILRASGQLKETSVEMQKLIDNMLRLPKE